MMYPEIPKIMKKQVEKNPIIKDLVYYMYSLNYREKGLKIKKELREVNHFSARLNQYIKFHSERLESLTEKLTYEFFKNHFCEKVDKEVVKDLLGEERFQSFYKKNNITNNTFKPLSFYKINWKFKTILEDSFWFSGVIEKVDNFIIVGNESRQDFHKSKMIRKVIISYLIDTYKEGYNIIDLLDKDPIVAIDIQDLIDYVQEEELSLKYPDVVMIYNNMKKDYSWDLSPSQFLKDSVDNYIKKQSKLV